MNKKAKNVLILEDEKDISSFIGDILEDHGLKCRSCGTIELAKREIEFDSNYGVLLVDLNLPDGSGVDFVRWVRTQEVCLGLRYAKVFIISGDYDAIDSALAADLNVANIIQKPFDHHLLLSCMGIAEM